MHEYTEKYLYIYMYDSPRTKNMKKPGEHFGFVRKFEIILHDTPNTM